jgi:hypothetical protein
MSKSSATSGQARRSQPRAGTTRKRGLNRAQQRAIEIRAAETNAPVAQLEPLPETPSPEEPAFRRSTISTSRTRREKQRVRTPIVRTIALTREQEYSFIRSDLKRMTITAGSLLGLMVVLLFVLS